MSIFFRSSVVKRLNQLQQLGRRPHVILGTPGRLWTTPKRSSLHLSDSIRRVMIDLMTDQIFTWDFTRHRKPNRSKQMRIDNCYSSPAIPDKIRNLAKQRLNIGICNSHEGKHITLDSIDQRVYMMNPEDKTPRLIKMIQEDNPYLAIVFCNNNEKAPFDYPMVDSCRSQHCWNARRLTQGRRTQILRDFAKAKTQILVSLILQRATSNIEASLM